MSDIKRTTLSDEELNERCMAWITDLCNRRRDWTMRIPADVDHDPDLLWGECLRRLRELAALRRSHAEAVEAAVREIEERHLAAASAMEGEGGIEFAVFEAEATAFHQAAAIIKRHLGHKGEQ